MTEITTLQFPPLAYRLKDFCQAVGISLRTFYTLKQRGDAPAITRIGGRQVIATPPPRHGSSDTRKPHNPQKKARTGGSGWAWYRTLEPLEE